MRPEWLPLPGDDAPDDLPVLLLAYYADDLGELCAGIAGRAPSDKSISSLYPRTIADNYYCFSLFGDIRLRKAGYEKSKGREMASGKRTPEPTGSFSVLLFLRQIQIITDEANRKNVSRQDVIRDLIDRGIESRQEEERVAA